MTHSTPLKTDLFWRRRSKAALEKTYEARPSTRGNSIKIAPTISKIASRYCVAVLTFDACDNPAHVSLPDVRRLRFRQFHEVIAASSYTGPRFVAQAEHALRLREARDRKLAEVDPVIVAGAGKGGGRHHGAMQTAGDLL